MRKIKLLVDCHVFDDFFQGTTTYLKGLYNELANDNNFEIYLAANNINKLESEFPNKSFKYLKLKNTSSFTRLWSEIPQIITKYKIDVAHFQYICPPVKNCFYITTIHDLLFLDFPQYFSIKNRIKYTALFYLASVRSDLICTVSEYSKKAILEHFKTKEEKLAITYNGVAIQSTQPVKTSYIKEKYGFGKYILYVSRIEPRKNHILLIRAFVELKLYEENYYLVLIGKNQHPVPEIRNYIDLLNNEVSEKIKFYENIDYSDLNLFYENAELFVFPSFAEGFGIPPLEAIERNCKTICSNKTALQEFEFLNNYFFDPNHISELKDKIIKTLSDDNYPYENIRQNAIDKYNWRSIAENFSKEICNRILN